MGTNRIAQAVVAAAVFAVAASAAAATRAPGVITTDGAIEALAMDGRTIAYDLEARGACNTLHVRDVGTGKDVVVSGALTCEADSTSTGAGVPQIAVAGSRVAWIVNLGGNTESTDVLLTATVGGKERQVAKATRTGDIDGRLDGGWIGNLAGDGGLIALNRWTTSGGAVAAATIRRLTTGLAILHTGLDSTRLSAVDSGRLAVVQADGVVAIRDAAGGLVSTFTPEATPREIALRKDFVVALEPRQLEVRLSITGAPVQTLPIPAGARNLDVHANVAVFTIGRTVHAVRLATGKQTIIATAPKAIVDAQIDDAGLVYAYNPVTGVQGVGKLAFIPLSLVRAKLT